MNSFYLFDPVPNRIDPRLMLPSTIAHNATKIFLLYNSRRRVSIQVFLGWLSYIGAQRGGGFVDDAEGSRLPNIMRFVFGNSFHVGCHFCLPSSSSLAWSATDSLCVWSIIFFRGSWSSLDDFVWTLVTLLNFVDSYLFDRVSISAALVGNYAILTERGQDLCRQWAR